MKKVLMCFLAIFTLLALSTSAMAEGCQHNWEYQGEVRGDAVWWDDSVHKWENIQIEICTKCGEVDNIFNGWEEEPHDLSGLKFTGEHYHKGSRHFYEYRGTCTVCDGSGVVWESVSCSGPPCPLPYSATSQVK